MSVDLSKIKQIALIIIWRVPVLRETFRETLPKFVAPVVVLVTNVVWSSVGTVVIAKLDMIFVKYLWLLIEYDFLPLRYITRCRNTY